MKKWISILLSVLLVLCGVSFSVSAEESGTVELQIAWDDMCFTYSPEWDAVNHEYVDSPVNGWKPNGDANSIIVVNNSVEYVVSVSLSYTDMAEGISAFVFYDAHMSPISGGTFSITPQSSETIKVLPVGVLSPDAVSKTQIGTIILTVNTVEG